uniref:Urocanate hydratase n=1 Tax=Anabas testudineus TaxID=64144 RepID=A0A7N6BAG3_ANATE
MHILRHIIFNRMSTLKDICSGLPLDPLPPNRGRDTSVPHAPIRTPNLTAEEERLALRNALRYFPPSHHETLAPEFAQELRQYGHIYMYRFCPTLRMRAYPIDQYPCRTRQAASLMLMIMNNLDPAVAQFPQELVTYGGNGQVFSNWAQFLLVMHYLSQMTEEQTLVMYSGHPMGLPCISVYGQMTAGSYCYIGPQGIVHGTMLTVLNAGRRYLGSGDLRGRVFVTSGLGGMSGAQAKAAVIAGCVGVIAEVDEAPLRKRHDQGWLMEVTSSMEHCIKRIREAKNSKTALSLGYHGNVVDLWERLALEYERTGELLVDLGSDQTSLHNPYNGGYYPVQLSFRQANQLMSTDSNRFCGMVQESLRRHIKAINKLSDAGMFFWDYGNAFLLEAKRAGADVDKFDIFLSLESNINLDLAVTDDIAAAVLEEIGASVSDRIRQQYNDNIRWIREAGKHKMAPVVISRDHHDVSGTDSPFRETSNVYDGSAFCADMAVQNFVGDAFRGATWVSLHNGGGVGWGEVINGGFGLLLDGSAEAAKRANIMLNWDVSNGVARRCWSGNSNAYETIQRTMEEHRLLRVTMPFPVQDDQVLDRALQG